MGDECSTARVADCDANGVPDICESHISNCPTDTNRDGETSAADLAGLLGAWGSSSITYDFNSDGAVNAQDLAALLAAWGPCSAK